MEGDPTTLYTKPEYMWMPGNIYNTLLLQDGRPHQYRPPTQSEWMAIGAFAIAMLAICWFCIVRPILKEGG